MVYRSLCPCVLKFDDNSTELASLVELNKKYQVSGEGPQIARELLCGLIVLVGNEYVLTLF